VEQKHLITELEGRVDSERERAEENEAARAALEERIGDLEAMQSKAGASEEQQQEQQRQQEQELQQVAAELERKLQAEKERADSHEAAGAALQDRINALEAAQSNVDEFEQQQLIAELESKLQVERERADRNESAESTLQERMGELEELQALVSIRDEEIKTLGTRMEAAQESKLNSERVFQSETEELMRDISTKQEYISKLEAEAGSAELVEGLRQETSEQKERIAQLEKALAEGGAGGPQGQGEDGEGGEALSKLQQKQNDTMHKLKAAVVKGKNIQKKLEVKTKELSDLQEENAKLLSELEAERTKAKEARMSQWEDAAAATQAVLVEEEEEGGPVAAGDGWGSGWEMEEPPGSSATPERSEDRGQGPPRALGGAGTGVGPGQGAPRFPRPGESDGEEDDDVKIDEALKSAGANLWNWVSGS